MKLYFVPGAPSPNRVRLYLAEKNIAGIVVPVQEVNLQGGLYQEAAHLARNALGKVPVLEVSDGTFVSESLAIAEYLEECYPEPSLFGRTALERAKVRELDRIAELRVFYLLCRYVQATVTQRARFPDPAIGIHYKGQLPVGLKALNREVQSNGPFIAGNRPTIVDCTLAAALEFGRTNGVNVLDEHEALGAWFERYRARDAVRSILNPPGPE